MALYQEKIYTIKDIYALPEGRRAKLIDGQIYDMAPPAREHQKIVAQLIRIIGNYIEATLKRRMAIVKYIPPHSQSS